MLAGQTSILGTGTLSCHPIKAHRELLKRALLVISPITVLFQRCSVVQHLGLRTILFKHRIFLLLRHRVVLNSVRDWFQ